MVIVALDDETLQLNMLMRAIRMADPTASVVGFSFPEDLLNYAQQKPFDVAFLDIQLYGTSGLDLAKK